MEQEFLRKAGEDMARFAHRMAASLRPLLEKGMRRNLANVERMLFGVSRGRSGDTVRQRRRACRQMHDLIVVQLAHDYVQWAALTLIVTRQDGDVLLPEPTKRRFRAFTRQNKADAAIVRAMIDHIPLMGRVPLIGHCRLVRGVARVVTDQQYLTQWLRACNAQTVQHVG